MTRTTNARIAGFTFLLYIAAGITSMVLSTGAMRGQGIAAKLVSIAEHETEMRIVVLLLLLISFMPLVLGVTLHAITREQDPDLAMLGLTCRVIEGIPGVSGTLNLLWLATAADAKALDPGAAQALGAYLLRGGGTTGAIFFAVGSTLFSWLLLRGRMIPAALAWLGVVASALLVVVLPLQLVGLLGGEMSWTGALAWLVWLPALVFELAFALWLLIKGVAAPASPALARRGA